MDTPTITAEEASNTYFQQIQAAHDYELCAKTCRADAQAALDAWANQQATAIGIQIGNIWEQKNPDLRDQWLTSTVCIIGIRGLISSTMNDDGKTRLYLQVRICPQAMTAGTAEMSEHNGLAHYCTIAELRQEYQPQEAV